MIDLTRSAITVALGIWDVDPVTTFEAGAPVGLNAAGAVVSAVDATNYLGVAKWNKTTALTAVVTDQPVVLTGTALSTLGNANLITASEQVRIGATVFTRDTHYNINYVNGTINRIVVAGGIPDGATVLVSYRYNMTAGEMLVLGRNYMNLFDDTLGSGKITVIQDYSLIFTDQYDTSRLYVMNAGLTVANGRFRPATGAEIVVARVRQVPTPADPFLGIQTI